MSRKKFIIEQKRCLQYKKLSKTNFINLQQLFISLNQNNNIYIKEIKFLYTQHLNHPKYPTNYVFPYCFHTTVVKYPLPF